MGPEIVIIPIVIAFMVAFALHAHHQARKRTASLAGWAAARRLYFHAGKVRSFDDEHPHLRCLRRGHSRYAYNIASGEMGGQVITSFDYHYATGSGKNRRTFRFSGILIKPPHPLLPLVIRREGFFDKMKAGFGFDDIDFESAEFSKTFYVGAANKQWAFDVIHQRTMHFLLGSELDRHGLSIECDYEVMCVYSKKLLEIPGIEYAHRHGKTILDEIPDYVRERFKSPA